MRCRRSFAIAKKAFRPCGAGRTIRKDPIFHHPTQRPRVIDNAKKMSTFPPAGKLKVRPMTDPFEILAADYRPMLLAYLRSMVADAHLAEDLAQETMLTAHKSIGTFEAGGNFGSWLRGIARNKALMHWRSAKRHPLLIDSRVVDGIDEVFAGLDRDGEDGDWWETRRSAMRNCISSLSGQLKAAIDRVYFGGNSLDEAAAALGSTRAAIGQRLTRARNLLRECVERKLKTTDDHA